MLTSLSSRFAGKPAILANGSAAVIRPLAIGDGDALGDFYESIPREDIRFYCPHPLTREKAAENAARALHPYEVVLVLEAADGSLHPVQRAFVEAGAVQCGFCTPGMVMRAVAFLNEHPNPTDEEIARAIEGNLCRCTGYVKIQDAIRSAAGMLAGVPAGTGS